jgi:hypothetical protein
VPPKRLQHRAGSGATKRAPGRFLEGWMAAARPWVSRLYADRAFARAMARRWAGRKH